MAAKYTLLTLLALHLLWRGLIPAFTRVDTDFPNYYVSARLAVEGRLAQVYDNDWFQQQIHAFGMNQLGKFSPYPPVSAFVAMPLVWLSPLNALRVWTLVNLVVLAAFIRLLSKTLKKDWVWSSVLVLLSGHALVNNFRMGQFYLILAFLCLCSLVLWERDRQNLSGVLMGIGAAVKYFPLIFIPLSLSRRSWRLSAAFFLTLLGLGLISLTVLGTETHIRFLQAVLIPHLEGDLQNRFSPTFQSWNSLLHRLFTYDSQLNPHPIWSSPAAYAIGLGIVYVSVLTALVTSIQKASQLRATESLSLQFALLSIGAGVLFPVSATYHFLLLIVPISILLAVGTSRWTTEQRVIVVLYGLMGFIPYSLLAPFDGAGLLTVLAYPRLILVSLIFGVSCIFVFGIHRHPEYNHQAGQNS